jgi:hypothetical protein
LVIHYERLLNFAYEVIDSIKGKPVLDAKRLAMQHVAMKIFLHAATVSHLREGSNVTLRAFPEGAHVVDFPSAIVLTRAILETYLNLFEIFFEPQNDDEFEYRRAVYEIKGFKALELAVQRNPNPASATGEDVLKTQMSMKALQEVRDHIRQTKTYQGLAPKQQEATLEGKLYPDRRLGERAIAAGFGKKFIEHTYMYMSSFTHGDALSVSQINSARTDDEKDLYFQVYMPLIMMVLSSIILNYTHRFPEAHAVYIASPNDKALVELLDNEKRKT